MARRPRFVTRPCDNLGDVDGLTRDRTWDVYDTLHEVSVGDYDTRAQARAAAREANQMSDNACS